VPAGVVIRLGVVLIAEPLWLLAIAAVAARILVVPLLPA
jgi:hypothetical protein